jgi:ankyrin repeat protein
MHLIYKVCRAETPAQLSVGFLVNNDPETRSFEEVQTNALSEMKSFLSKTPDVNSQSKDLGGATQLWKAAEQGHVLAAQEILQHPNTNPNKTHKDTTTTPLYVAAHYGHVEVVRAILQHPAG